MMTTSAEEESVGIVQVDPVPGPSSIRLCPT
jgi:hypothetical protein